MVGGDINLKYLFTRPDFSLFIGGGMGIQWVIPLDDSMDGRKRNSGPALSAQGEMVFFRTYDIHLIAKAQYQFVFNTDLDNGMTYDLGIVYRPSANSRGGFRSSFWKIYLAGILELSIAGAGSD